MSRSLELNIQKTIIDLEKLNNRKSLWKSRRISKILGIRKKQLSLLLDLLELEDSEFNSLWNRNMDLLQGENLKFSVTRVEIDLLNGHASKLTGKIDKNGKIIAIPSGRFNPFMTKKFFPKIYVGKIDAIGQLALNSSSLGLNFIARNRPKSFIGSISSKGEIQMQISEKINEFWQSNNIGQIVCNPFGTDNERKAEFLENKDIIMRKAAQRLKQIEKQLMS